MPDSIRGTEHLNCPRDLPPPKYIGFSYYSIQKDPGDQDEAYEMAPESFRSDERLLAFFLKGVYNTNSSNNF